MGPSGLRSENIALSNVSAFSSFAAQSAASEVEGCSFRSRITALAIVRVIAASILFSRPLPLYRPADVFRRPLQHQRRLQVEERL